MPEYYDYVPRTPISFISHDAPQGAPMVNKWLRPSEPTSEGNFSRWMEARYVAAEMNAPKEWAALWHDRITREDRAALEAFQAMTHREVNVGFASFPGL